MAALSFEARNNFITDLSTTGYTQQLVTNTQYARSCDRKWEQWTHLCTEFNVDPSLHEVDDPVRLLEVYAIRTRDGRLSNSGQPVRSSTVDQDLRSVGQTFS